MPGTLNASVGLYPSGMRVAPSVPTGASAPSSSGPGRAKGLFYSGMPSLTPEDFQGPAHSRVFVTRLGRRLPYPPADDILGSLSKEDLLGGSRP